MSDAPATKPQMPVAARVLLFALPGTLLGVVALGGWWATELLNTPPTPTTELAHAGNDPDGGALYNFHCARCHGVNGDGEGDTPMSPKARHFGYDRFKFTDTLNGAEQPQGAAGTLGGIPTDNVLFDLLKRGIDGSPMPSFAHLPDGELKAIVGYVRSRFVRPDRMAASRDYIAMKKEEKFSLEEGFDFDPKKDWPPKSASRRKKWEEDWNEWLSEAVADITASHPCPVPKPFPEPTPGYEIRGAALFTKLGCNGCHGLNGAGTFDPNRKNDNGTVAYPRDLTAGVYKGGANLEDLYRRIYLGIPGTPMKAFGKEAKPEEIIDLVYYVKTFANPSKQVAGELAPGQ